MRHRFDRQSAIKAGLGCVAIAFLLLIGGGAFLIVLFGIFYFVVVGGFAVAGFLFLISSIFLPARRTGKPTFTEELLGKESLHYGTFTRGNWMTVLDEEKKRKEDRRKHRSTTS
jgi:hypothetical protein